MRANYFIDSNVLLYCYSKTEPAKRQRAREIASQADTILSLQVLRESANVLSRKFGHPWSDIIRLLQEVQRQFPLFVESPDTLLEACRLADRYHYSLYDSLIIASALETACEHLYSEDLQHDQLIAGRLRIVNPFADKQ